MSTPNVDPSGNNQPLPVEVLPGNEPPKKETVAYETHLKLLDEKKKLKERLDSLEAAAKKREEDDLKAKEDFKKIAELKEQEANEFKQKLELVEARERNAIKLDAFLKTLDGKVDQKFWGHVDLDAILVNPDTGELDKMSVAKVVEKFRKEYPEIIQRPGQNQLPNAAAAGASGSKLTYEEWLKLPPKEMAARRNEVRRSEGDLK